MPNIDQLLPPSATQLQVDLVKAFDRDLFEGLNVFDTDAETVPFRHLYNPDTIPANLIPYVAFVLSVDYWDDEWSESQMREVVRNAYRVRAIKGTLQSVETVCEALGFTVTTITESSGVDWAKYNITIGQPISNDVAALLIRLIESTAPLRSELETITYTAAVNNYDGAVTYDGSFNYGTV